MGDMLLVVEFEHSSGLPEDRVSNTWVVSDDVADTMAFAERQAVVGDLANFYQVPVAGQGPNPVLGFFSPAICRPGGSFSITAYDVAPGTEAAGGDLGDPIHQVSGFAVPRSEEHTSELQSRQYLVCRLLLEKKKTLAL